MPTLKSVKWLCYRVLRGAPLTLRTRRRSPSSSPEPFSIPVHRTISPELFRPVHQIRLAAPFTSTVLRPRFQLCSPSSSPEPSSILVSETVLSPVSLLRPPSSSSELFSILVFSPVHRIRLRNRSPSRLRNRSPSTSPKPSFILVFSPVHRIRLRNRPPSSFSAALFFGGCY